MSLSCFSSSTSFIVRVTSTVTNSVTCGAVNAEPTIAAAVALRTPFTGTRVSRDVSYVAEGARGATGAAGATGVAACAGAAAACTSSRVITPSGPDGVTVARSTPGPSPACAPAASPAGAAPRRRAPPHGRSAPPVRPPQPPPPPARSPGPGSPPPCAGGAWWRTWTLRSPRGPVCGPPASPQPPEPRGGLGRGLRRSGAARHVHGDDGRADVHRRPLGEAEFAHHAVVRNGQFHGGLRRLHLADDLAVGDGVAGLDVPLEDLGLGEALAHVRHLELAYGRFCHRRHDPLLSTPERGRRRRAPGPGSAGTPPPGGPAGTGRDSRRP